MSWNSRLYPHDDVVHEGPECLAQREKFLWRIFLRRAGSIDVPDSLHKIEVHPKSIVSYLHASDFLDLRNSGIICVPADELEEGAVFL